MKVTNLTKPITSQAQTLPLYRSRPAAGFPAPGDDVVERSLDINEYIIKHPEATFFVRVAGDSMEGAGIYSGDILVVDRSLSPRSGAIVVAAVYGELVVKRFQKTTGHAMLCSEQAGYDPIILNDAEDCFLWGVVVGSVRSFW